MYLSNILKAERRVVQTFAGGEAYSGNYQDLPTITYTNVYTSGRLPLQLPAGCVHFLLPVVGNMWVDTMDFGVRPEEICVVHDAEDVYLTIANPSVEDTLSLMHISLPKATLAVGRQGVWIEQLPITRRNQLHRGTGAASCISIGVYDSRTKDAHALSGNNSCTSSFVINGAFDFEERLLEHHDTLYQWQVQNVDFEALSEIAILLIIESSPFKTEQVWKE